MSTAPIHIRRIYQTAESFSGGMKDLKRKFNAAKDIDGSTPKSRKRYTMESIRHWKNLNDLESEAALKKGFDENAGRCLEYSGQYLSGTGKNLGFFGKLARVAKTIFGLNVSLCVDFMLASAAWISYRDDKDMEAMSEALHFFVMVSNVTLISLSFLRNRPIFDRLFTSIGAGFFSYGDMIDEETKQQMEKHISEMKNRKKLRMKVFASLVWSCGIVLMGKPILGYVRFRDRIDGEGDTVVKRHIVPVWFPGVGRWPIYILTVCLCYMAQIWVMGTIFGLVLPWIGFVEELTAQLEIIGMGLKRLTARARHMYIAKYGREHLDKENYSKCVKEALKASAIHHITILEVCSDFRRLSSIPLLTISVNSALLLCMQGFLLIEKDVPTLAKVTSSVFLVSELIYTYMYFAYCDNLTRASEEIGSQLYLSDWTSVSGTVFPYYSFMKLRTSKPFKLTAAGFIEIDLTAFAQVISSSYSYFNLMLSNKK